MKTVLIVDDERPFLLSLEEGLAAFSDRFNVICAGNGEEALEIFQKQKIDLLVTDLKMPVMDGFQLITEVMRIDPYLPVIVMTAFGTPEIEERISAMTPLHYLEKPIDFDTLTQMVDKASATEPRSYIRGITLSAFLQLVNMERKSCTLKVCSQGENGFLFIHKGELYDAQTAHLDGESAAMEIIGWDATDIEMDTICRRKEKRIDSSLEFLLLETFRLKDETNAEQAFISPPTREAAPAFPSGQAIPDEKRESPELGPVAVESDQKLLNLLKKTSAIQEFAVFDKGGGLKFHSPEPCSLLKVCPEIFLAECTSLETSAGMGVLRFLQLITATRKTTLIFRRGRHQIVLTLNKGAQPAKFLEQLSPSLFEKS
ncbi:MAG: response regulator [Desulfuromonadaceae bacterium]|nr:response regulator [Desulfuromonadaceae bacterium]